MKPRTLPEVQKRIVAHRRLIQKLEDELIDLLVTERVLVRLNKMPKVAAHAFDTVDQGPYYMINRKREGHVVIWHVADSDDGYVYVIPEQTTDKALLEGRKKYLRFSIDYFNERVIGKVTETYYG